VLLPTLGVLFTLREIIDNPTATVVPTLDEDSTAIVERPSAAAMSMSWRWRPAE